VVTFTPRAGDALRASLVAARRFDPGASLRVERSGGGVRAVFVAETASSDVVVDLGGGLTVGIEEGLEGTIDAGEHNELTVVAP
jgi:hypothetical protein